MMLVPMYSLNSWAAIYWTSSAYVFNCGRECYEAYVLYSLGKLLLEFLDFSVSGSLDEARTPGEALTAHLVQRARSKEAALEAAAASQGGGATVPAPAREAAWRTHIGLLYMALPEGGAAGTWRALLPRYLMEPAWRVDTLVTNVRLAVFQYVVVRCGCAGLTLLTAYLGCYCEGSLSAACSWPWIFAAVSASQFTAACWVFVLYAEFHDELERLNPVAPAPLARPLLASAAAHAPGAQPPLCAPAARAHRGGARAAARLRLRRCAGGRGGRRGRRGRREQRRRRPLPPGSLHLRCARECAGAGRAREL
jgi:hypothetical protein